MQYRETDFNFLSRTLEQYGVFYYFKFEDGKHTLVLDLKKNYPVCVEAEVTYPRVSGGAAGRGPHHQLAARLRVRAGQVDAHRLQLRDAVDAARHECAAAAVGGRAAGDKYEVYDYPGGYAVKPDGESDARVRQEERELPHNSVDGASTCRTFTPGTSSRSTAIPTTRSCRNRASRTS